LVTFNSSFTYYRPNCLISIRHKNIAVNASVILFPIVVFFLYVCHYAINVPYLDDMDLVYTINDIEEKPQEILSILARQQNDHRIFFSRLGMLWVYLLTDEINFRYATILGFVNLLLLAYAFYLIYKQYRQDLLGFAPIVILLFSPLVYFVHLSSLPAYQHSLSVAFSLLSLYFLQSNQQKRWYWALPFAFASTLTILDGLSTIPIGLAWLLIQRRFQDSFIFGLVSSLWLAVYFSDFSLSSSSKLAFTPDTLLAMSYGFVAFVGAFFRLLSDTHSLQLSFAAGVVMLVSFGYLVVRQMAGKMHDFSLNQLSLSKLELVDIAFLRMLASGAMIAIGRTGLSIEVVTAVRFQVFSLSVAILFYLLVIRVLHPRYKQRFLALSLCFGILGNLYAYAKYDHEARELVEELKADAYNYKNHHIYLHQYYNLPDPPEKFYRNYSFPRFFGNDLISAWQSNSISFPTISLLSKEKENKGPYSNYIYPAVELLVQHVPQRVPHQNVYLLLQSARAPFDKYIVSVSENNSTFLSAFLHREARNRIFQGLFLLKIPRKKYKVRLCWVERNTPQSILVSSDYRL
jgi:hypothetical protein